MTRAQDQRRSGWERTAHGDPHSRPQRAAPGARSLGMVEGVSLLDSARVEPLKAGVQISSETLSLRPGPSIYGPGPRNGGASRHSRRWRPPICVSGFHSSLGASCDGISVRWHQAAFTPFLSLYFSMWSTNIS